MSSGATQEEAPASRPAGGESFGVVPARGGSGVTTGARRLRRRDQRGGEASELRHPRLRDGEIQATGFPDRYFGL